MKRPVIYYHLWRGGDWRAVNARIFSALAESGLADYADTIHICVNDGDSTSDIELYGLPEDKVLFRQVKNTGSEWPTLEALYEDYVSESDVPVMYLHSKGASYPDGDPRVDGVRSWVDGLLYYTVEDWRACLSMMRLGALAVGANKRDTPTVHYSGNFWWISADALKALPNPKLQDQSHNNRFGAEFWIGHLGTVNLKNNGLVGFDYLKKIPRSLYEKPLKISRKLKNLCIHVDDRMDLTPFINSGLPYDTYRNGLNSYARTYIEYIIANYEDLPEYTYFIRTSQVIAHSPNIFDLVEHWNPNGFEFMSKGILDCNGNGGPHHPGLPVERFWNAIYPEQSAPESYRFGAGAQFAVHRDKILLNSLDFYIDLLGLISTRINPVEDFILERLWGLIFAEKEATVSDFDLEVFIFNYGLMDNALKMRQQFYEVGVNAVILDSDSGNPVPELDYVHSFDNIFYSGLWNEALNLFQGSHMMVVTSDVEIPDPKKLVNNAKVFYKSDKAWIYAPNVNYTFWEYELSALENYSRDIKLVPNTDGMCWMLSSDAVYSVGNIDNEINKIGFGVDLLAAMFAKKAGKLVGRDYSITVKHPQTRSYDSSDAETQEFEWISSLGYLQEYVPYRNHYAMSFLR